MRCYDCKGNYTKKKGSISLSNDIIGNFEVHNVTYYKCRNCNKLLFPGDTAVEIEKKEREIKLELLNRLPVQDFVTASQAAYLLGISKQAFHKNVRIKNGFIYCIELDGKKVYNKKSVLLFKEEGDGRFLLKIKAADKPRYVSRFYDFFNEKKWNRIDMFNKKLYKYV